MINGVHGGVTMGGGAVLSEGLDRPGTPEARRRAEALTRDLRGLVEARCQVYYDGDAAWKDLRHKAVGTLETLEALVSDDELWHAFHVTVERPVPELTDELSADDVTRLTQQLEVLGYPSSCRPSPKKLIEDMVGELALTVRLPGGGVQRRLMEAHAVIAAELARIRLQVETEGDSVVARAGVALGARRALSVGCAFLPAVAGLVLVRPPAGPVRTPAGELLATLMGTRRVPDPAAAVQPAPSVTENLLPMGVHALSQRFAPLAPGAAYRWLLGRRVTLVGHQRFSGNVYDHLEAVHAGLRAVDRVLHAAEPEADLLGAMRPDDTREAWRLPPGHGLQQILDDVRRHTWRLEQLLTDHSGHPAVHVSAEGLVRNLDALGRFGVEHSGMRRDAAYEQLAEAGEHAKALGREMGMLGVPYAA